MYIRLRSVLRGLCILNAHLTVYLYTPAWMFLCLFSSKAVVGQIVKQARVKHPRFLYVAINRVRINLTYGCLSELKNISKTITGN